MQVPDAYREAKNKVYQDSVLSPLVRRGRQYIQRHYADPELTLEKLASVLRVSPVHLSRSFKQELGISFIALLTQTRMNKAMELLSNSELTINEIAERVGYNTQHYFSTSFKKWIGVSPNQYRRGESISETTE